LPNGYFFAGSPLALRSDYLAQWKEIAAQASPMIDDGSLFGFMMGDELLFNGLSYDSLNVSINLVKSTFPSAVVYYNEAYPIFTTTNYEFPSVPPMLDLFSVDIYPCDGFTFETTYALYVDKIYPLLHANQKVMYVSPGYSTTLNNVQYCGNPVCENAFVAWNQQSFNWALTDGHFAGLFPWHWDQFNVTFLPGFEYGVVQLPYLKEVMFNIGKQIIHQNVTITETASGGICGLGTNQYANTTCDGVNSLEKCPSGFEQQVWDIGVTGSGKMGFCALETTSHELPVGAICGLNLMAGQVVMCGGIDPYAQDPYCPKGYVRQEWSPTNWGGGSFFYCAKSEPGPDLPGTICGMMTGSTGVLCNGVNPEDFCPEGYAPAAWDIPFGSGLWSVCFKTA
jgi:hypothetical protein